MYICQLQNTKCGLPPWLSRLRVAISRRKCATIQQKNEWTQKWPYEKDALARESTLCRPSTHWMTLADQKFISLTTIQVEKRIKDKTESFWIRELQTLHPVSYGILNPMVNWHMIFWPRVQFSIWYFDPGPGVNFFSLYFEPPHGKLNPPPHFHKKRGVHNTIREGLIYHR